MAKVTEIRLTLAALIYALEIDLKNIINTYLASTAYDLSFLKDDGYIEKIKSRFLKEFPGIIPENNIVQLIDYVDFQDTYTIILKNPAAIPIEIFNEIKSLALTLDLIVPIRNRVMHTRPLQVGDFMDVYSFICELKETSKIQWNTTFETKLKIEEDPSYVLTLSIPSFKFGSEETNHNLPLPDFDETGFIGRKKDIEDIKRLILGNNRVVSIIGDGGIGKTALALKIAYDIVDLKEKNPFDLIIWISAKTTMLTAKGIEDIDNALKDYGGIIEGISDTFKIKRDASDEKLDEILEYLDVFDILLIIDNLETILDENIKEFIREAQMRCKIMITSRIGLGELEFRRNLYGLSESEVITLLRQFATIKQSTLITQLPNNKLLDIARKLYFNPLALKWFVNTVETGVNPDEVLTRKGDLLNFCLSNVYEKLSQDAKHLVSIILASRRSLNEAELIFLSELPSIILRKTLNELFSTTFITREIENNLGSQEVKFTIPEFSKEYLLKKHLIKSDFIQKINQRLISLSRKTDEIIRVSGYNEFGLNAISIRNSTEKVTAKLLAEALKFSKIGKLEASYAKIEEAKSILPNYFEVYRIGAFIKATYDDYLGAEQDYKIGLEIEPNNPRLLYFYAGFLFFQLNDIDKAFPLAKKLIEIRPDSPYPTYLYARCLAKRENEEEAITVLRNLLNNIQLNDENKRIAVTDLINVYSHWGARIIQKDGDFEFSKEKYLKGISYFERMVKERNFDEKMIKMFGTCVISFIKNIPKVNNEENIKFIQELVVKYSDMLELNSKDYILYLLKEQYNSELNTYVPKYKGKLEEFDILRPFVFIAAENGERFYANKKNFKPGSWSTLHPFDTVRFDIGSNLLGECAINIIKD